MKSAQTISISFSKRQELKPRSQRSVSARRKIQVSVRCMVELRMQSHCTKAWVSVNASRIIFDGGMMDAQIASKAFRLKLLSRN